MEEGRIKGMEERRGKKGKRIELILASFFVLLFSFFAPQALDVQAQDATSTNFKVLAPVISELGGYATSSSFQLWGSIPFIEPRTGSSTTFILKPGFLNFATGTLATSTPDDDDDDDDDQGGGGGGGPPGRRPPRPIPPEVCVVVDFNHDGFVDFVDFSILLYYYDKERPETDPYDLNSDGEIDIVDISIFMYYWDGERVKCEV